MTHVLSDTPVGVFVTIVYCIHDSTDISTLSLGLKFGVGDMLYELLLSSQERIATHH